MKAMEYIMYIDAIVVNIRFGTYYSVDISRSVVLRG